MLYLKEKNLFDMLFLEDFNLPNVKQRKSLIENDENYLFELAAPGISKSDVSAKLLENEITISYNKEFKDGEAKFTCSNYETTFIIPTDVNVDKINVTVENGIIKITLPKTKKPNKEKIIEIQ
jgi:HSP20 family protein